MKTALFPHSKASASKCKQCSWHMASALPLRY